MDWRWATGFRILLAMAMIVVATRPSAAQFNDLPPGYVLSENSASPSPAKAVKAAASGSGAARVGADARQLFGGTKAPAALEARAIGSYARGCLAGAAPLALDGPAWQAMRLSRNRNWGHPKLIALVERLAVEAKAKDGWPGLLVGDLAQPRGGPMLTGHASHQIGLDADIWLTPMPDRRLSREEREELSATSMLGPDQLTVDLKIWTPAHVALVRRAAGYPEVERVLVHPGIKQALCQQAGGGQRAWLGKVRPYWGHHYHMHVRIGCPKGSTDCEPQAPTTGDDGCGKELDDWFKVLKRPPSPPGPPKPPLTLEQLPAVCKVVLNAPAPTVETATQSAPGAAKAAASKRGR